MTRLKIERAAEAAMALADSYTCLDFLLQIAEDPSPIKPILNLIDFYYQDSFVSPFILGTLVSGEAWASDMEETPKQRILCAIMEIEQQLLVMAA